MYVLPIEWRPYPMGTLKMQDRIMRTRNAPRVAYIPWAVSCWCPALMFVQQDSLCSDNVSDIAVNDDAYDVFGVTTQPPIVIVP